ncbi:MAG: sulfur carrier protein ThiS, partial [Bacteroidetes bacterium]
ENMNIQLNNRNESIPEYKHLTIQQLLEVKNFSYKMLLVRVNDTTVKREDYDTTVIKDGDKVAVIHLMAGG